jgi:hypothetical protein
VNNGHCPVSGCQNEALLHCYWCRQLFCPSHVIDLSEGGRYDEPGLICQNCLQSDESEIVDLSE